MYSTSRATAPSRSLHEGERGRRGRERGGGRGRDRDREEHKKGDNIKKIREKIKHEPTEQKRRHQI
jgi:hypothetical protein